MQDDIDKNRAREITPEALSMIGSPDLVYVRETTVADITRALPEYFSNEDFSGMAPGKKVYALHAANGAYMAVVDSRNAALSVARHNQFTPVSVH